MSRPKLIACSRVVESDEDSERILATERTRLVPLAERHVAALIRHWAPEDIQRYLASDAPFTWEKVNEVVARSNRDFDRCGYGLWAMCEVDGEETLGAFGLQTLAPETGAELLFGLRPRYRGRGLTREGILAVLNHGFRDMALPRIITRHTAAGPRHPAIAELGVAESLTLNGKPFSGITRAAFMDTIG